MAIVWLSMGAMEVTKGEEKVQDDGGRMPRAPSVDDLFGPMGRLDMHSLGAGTGNQGENASLSNLCAAVKASSPPGGEYMYWLLVLRPDFVLIFGDVELLGVPKHHESVGSMNVLVEPLYHMGLIRTLNPSLMILESKI